MTKFSSEKGLLEKMLNCVVDMICAIDSDGRFVQVSAASFNILGYQPDELIGKLFMDYIISEDVAHTVEEFNKIHFKENFTTYVENFYIHKNGDSVPLTWSGYWSEEDQLFFCIAREASLLYKTRKALIRQQELFRTFATHGSDLLGLLDAEGLYTYISDSVTRILGYTSEEIVGTSPFDYIHADDVARAREHLKNLEPDKQIILSDFRFKAADGTWRWILTSINNQLENPAIQAYVISSRDITERKKMRLQLEESEQKFRALFDNNPDVVYYQDTEGIILEVNLACKKLYGLNSDEIVNTSVFSYLHEEDVDNANKEFNAVLSGLPRRYEAKVYLDEVSPVYLDLTKIPVLLNGKVTGIYTIAKDVTELKQTYQAMLKQARRLNAVLESITDAFVILDKNWTIIHLNTVFEHISGRSRSEIIGNSIWAIFPEERNGIFHKNYQKALDTNKPVFFENYYDKEDIWLAFKVFPFEDGLSVYAENISIFKRNAELEKLGKEILEMNARPENDLKRTIDNYLRGLENIYPGMICTVLELHKEALQIYSAPSLPDEFKQLCVELIPFPEPDSFGNAAFSGRKVMVNDIENDSNWKNNLELAIKFNLRVCWSIPMINSKNQVLGTLAVFYKNVKEPSPEEISAIENASNLLSLIVENKQSEEALLYSNERYYLATEASNDAIYEWDPGSGKIYWANGFERIFGHKMENVPINGNDYVEHFFHPDDIPKVRDFLNDAILDPEVNQFTFENKLLKANGTYACVIDRGKIVRNKEGNVTRIVGAVKDVTEQKKIEEEREKIIKELQQHVNSLQQFTNIVSHNLRAPVANILGLTKLFELQQLDELQRLKIIDNLQISAKNLDSILIDLNEVLSKRGNLGELVETLRFDQKLMKVLHANADLIEKFNVTVNFNFEDAPTVRFVKSYMQSILYNLLSNAIKYRSPDRDTVINIFTKKEKGFTVLYVSDNGIGIDLDRNKDIVFGLYKRFHTHVEGKGLGLFLIKTQVESLGGHVEVESEVNVGTTFKIFFK